MKNSDMRFLLLEIILADQLADLPPISGIYWSRMEMTFLLLELIMADEEW